MLEECLVLPFLYPGPGLAVMSYVWSAQYCRSCAGQCIAEEVMCLEFRTFVMCGGLDMKREKKIKLTKEQASAKRRLRYATDPEYRQRILNNNKKYAATPKGREAKRRSSQKKP